jgi:hypothetical protein
MPSETRPLARSSQSHLPELSGASPAAPQALRRLQSHALPAHPAAPPASPHTAVISAGQGSSRAPQAPVLNPAAREKWYETVEALSSTATDLEEHRLREAASAWAKVATSIAATRAEEARISEQLETVAVRRKLEEIERARELDELRIEALTAVPSVYERRRLKKLDRAALARSERKVLQVTEERRAALIEELWERRAGMEQDRSSFFTEGPQMLSRFGQLLSATTHNLVSLLNSQLDALYEEGIALGKLPPHFRGAGAKRVAMLNPLDMSPCLTMGSDAWSVRHTDAPSVQPRWGMIRCVRGDWLKRRTDLDVIKGFLRQEIVSLSQKEVGRDAALRSLARFLDAVHPTHKLHARVLADQRNAVVIVEARAKELNYDIPGGSLKSLMRNERLFKGSVLDVLAQIEARLARLDRFYFEARPPKETGWAVGLSFGSSSSAAAEREGFPGAHAGAYSMGLQQSGVVFWNGESKAYSTPLYGATTVGVLVDLKQGCVTFYCDGKDLGPAFGKDGVFRLPEDMTQIRETLRNQQVVPAFALLGPTPGSLLRRNKKKGSRSGEEETEGPVLVVNFGATPFAAAPEQLVASGVSGTVEVGEAAPSLEAMEALLAEGVVLARQPHVAAAAAAAEAAEAATLAAAASTAPAAADETAAEESAPVARGSGGGGGGGNIIDMISAARLEAKAQQELEEDARRTAVLTERRRLRFLTDLAPEAPKSWSTFMTSKHGREKAARKIQQKVRAWLTRRAFLRIRSSVRTVQLLFKLQMPFIRRRKARAATVLQRWWRGLRARRLYAFALFYKTHPVVLERAAIMIQSHVRRAKARVAALALAAQVRAEVAAVNAKVARIQRVWRRHLFDQIYEEPEGLEGAREHMRGHRAAAAVQRVWRRYAKRRVFWHMHLRRQAATRIQRLVRGFLTRLRLDSELDNEDAVFLVKVRAALKAARGRLKWYQPTTLRLGSGAAINYHAILEADLANEFPDLVKVDVNPDEDMDESDLHGVNRDAMIRHRAEQAEAERAQKQKQLQQQQQQQQQQQLLQPPRPQQASNTLTSDEVLALPRGSLSLGPTPRQSPIVFEDDEAAERAMHNYARKQ